MPIPITITELSRTKFTYGYTNILGVYGNSRLRDVDGYILRQGNTELLGGVSHRSDGSLVIIFQQYIPVGKYDFYLVDNSNPTKNSNVKTVYFENPAPPPSPPPPPIPATGFRISSIMPVSATNDETVSVFGENLSTATGYFIYTNQDYSGLVESGKTSVLTANKVQLTLAGKLTVGRHYLAVGDASHNSNVAVLEIKKKSIPPIVLSNVNPTTVPSNGSFAATVTGSGLLNVVAYRLVASDGTSKGYSTKFNSDTSGIITFSYGITVGTYKLDLLSDGGLVSNGVDIIINEAPPRPTPPAPSDTITISSVSPTTLPISGSFTSTIIGLGLSKVTGYRLVGNSTVTKSIALGSDTSGKITFGYGINAGTYKLELTGASGLVSNGINITFNEAPPAPPPDPPTEQPTTEPTEAPPDQEYLAVLQCICTQFTMLNQIMGEARDTFLDIRDDISE